MSDSPVRKFQSGKEVLEAFIPGYFPPRTTIEEDVIKQQKPQALEELKDELLSGLKAKLDQLNLNSPPQ